MTKPTRVPLPSPAPRPGRAVAPRALTAVTGGGGSTGRTKANVISEPAGPDN